ncbi:CidA/LrgA family protein [Actibacterium sp. D379-3]
MILNLTILLIFQLAGEVTSRALGLPLPGPVVGMAFLLIFLMAAPRVAARLHDTVQGLLSHLSLLFVPAGVGIVGHLNLLERDGGPILLALILSTVAAIAVGALVFTAVARMTGSGNA